MCAYGTKLIVLGGSKGGNAAHVLDVSQFYGPTMKLSAGNLAPTLNKDRLSDTTSHASATRMPLESTPSQSNRSEVLKDGEQQSPQTLRSESSTITQSSDIVLRFLRENCPTLMKKNKFKLSSYPIKWDHWTIGDDENIGYRGWIDRGGTGDVYQVFTNKPRN
jgi:hypothetical protein